MNASKLILMASIVGVLVLSEVPPSGARPCCIVLVPPPPPPPPAGEAISTSYGAVFAQLPLLAGLERKVFGSLKVEIQRRDFKGAAAEVDKSQGVLGLGTINGLAQFNASSGGQVRVIAVVTSRPDYGLFTRKTGPTSLVELKGKVIAIPAYGSLAHLFSVKALITAGLTEKDVKFVIADAPSEVAMVTHGGVDAAPLFIGFKSKDPDFSPKTLVGPQSIVLPSWMLYAGQATLDREAGKIGQLVRGVEEGVKLVRSDMKLVRNILERFGIVGENAQAFMQVIPLVLSDTVRPNEREITQTIDLLKSVGWIKESPVLTEELIIRKLYGQGQ